ncbi:MAG: cysteine desulfurase [Deltaproteobacteria bacterium RBG_13_53_10]|nr:MAG: cysteine desulfurase [Deltaproteobacteria bacterium RBG_13_53_10]
MIYLDNASTTYPKPESVYTEMDRCLREYCANPGRGSHALSRTAGEAVQQTRETIARLFNFDEPERLIFTKNATEALNLAIKGILNPGDHAIATSLEHNSVVRPLKELEKEKGIELTFVQGDAFGEVRPDAVAEHIRKNTRLIACTLSSNVNGIIFPVAEIGKIAHERHIPYLVDASQGAGSIPIDVKETMIDLLAFPGHKGLLGPQGTGGLYMRDGLNVKSFIQGGTGSQSENPYQPEGMPEAFESGTLNTPGIIGLRAGIEFINRFGMERIRQHKQDLVSQMHEGLTGHKNITIYSQNHINNNSGIVAINIKGMKATNVSKLLDENYQIATRAGLHCAPLAHQTLGYTVETGVLRFSVGCFNTSGEIDDAVKAVQEIAG